jgi:hypothetical protein
MQRSEGEPAFLQTRFLSEESFPVSFRNDSPARLMMLTDAGGNHCITLFKMHLASKLYQHFGIRHDDFHFLPYHALNIRH